MRSQVIVEFGSRQTNRNGNATAIRDGSAAGSASRGGLSFRCVYVPVQTRPLAEGNRWLNNLRQGQIVSRVVLTP